MSSTSWNFYTTNPTAWDAMIHACSQAKESIDLEAFIFFPDEVGNRFIEVCAKKASEGVRVRFIWDAAGSFSFFGSSIIKDLKQKGIDLIFFKTLLPHFFSVHNYRAWYFRNHRRTLIVDGKVGFTGSVCISKRMESWRDTQVKLEGPVVGDMEMDFENMWSRAHKKRWQKDTKRKYGVGQFEYVTNSPMPRRRFLYMRMMEAIREADKSIYITVPYFVPTHSLARVLRLAAHRGVDVRIILPENSDFPTVDLGARTFFHSLLKTGIRIYLYKEKMIHTKSIIIDKKWSTVGTLNLDHISLRHNFEANIVTDNKDFASELLEHFDEDLKNSREITFDEWKSRFFVEKIATFFVKFIRGFL